MAVSLGKLTIIIGAGLVGTALSKEGRLSDVTSFFSGAVKIVSKHLQQDKDSSQSSGKSNSDSLLAQVNTLRQELQLLASSRSVTIVTGSSSGSGTYGVTAVVIVGAVGYGYIWWKGWKLTDMMFVTRRTFSDACTTVGKKVDIISSAVSSAKRHLSSSIDRVDRNLNESVELTIATKGEVSELHGQLSGVHLDVESVQSVVQTLVIKLDRIEETQDLTTKGVYDLCKFVQGLEQCRNMDKIEILPSNSRPALEPPEAMPMSQAASFAPLSPSSPSSSSTSSVASIETPKFERVLRPNALSASAFKELTGISNSIKASSSRPITPTSAVPEIPIGFRSFREPSSSSSSTTGGLFGWKLPSMSILTRTRSAAS